MAVCQSGFHDLKLQKRLIKVPVEGGQRVVVCDFCLSRLMEAQQGGGDLTMTILYQWAKDRGDIQQLPESLKRDCMSRCRLVQFVNQQLLDTRTTNMHFPKILLNPDEKERFIRSLQSDATRNVLADVDSDIERTNIALRLWTGCLCVTKECMISSVTEYSPDGTIKREIPYTPEMRAESFKKIMRTVYEDPVYRAGVEVAPVWDLIVNAEPNKKMYLDGILSLHSSPVTKYIKNKNKTIISPDDIEEELVLDIKGSTVS
jgi:hypothetical protein